MSSWHTDLSTRVAYAHDASAYSYTPAAVVMATGADHVSELLASGAGPLTFRSGGTSLCGQSVTDEILVDTRRNFRGITVGPQGETVRVEPGAVLRGVNARLVRHGRKLGPDPASEIACTIGGVVANNSSGMTCGTTANTYQTLRSLVLILADGTRIDTGATGAVAEMVRSAPRIHAGLADIRDRIRADSVAVALLEHLFSMKNTMGYGLNSFLDYDEPIDILRQLIVGSEGTLAFVAEAEFDTVPLLTHVATGFLLFDDLLTATRALPALVASGAATIELLDAGSLIVASRDEAAPQVMRSLQVGAHAGLLVEYQHATRAELDRRLAELPGLVAQIPGADAGEGFTTDARLRNELWHIRKGLFAAIAGARSPGSTALLEDIAVPVAELAQTCEDLQALFHTHGYEDAVIFGHAKDGNIHFMMNVHLDEPEALGTYATFTDDMVDLVLRRGGTLKAEHGTGRMMAPYMERQYGPFLTAIMREIKDLFDPAGMLNPGVILTDDPTIHLQNLKSTPQVEASVDTCVECGYCEPVCPSRNITLTPRQRIVLRRELAAAETAGDTERVAQLRLGYEYLNTDTCAVDGMCATACPLGINTGDLVRTLRERDAGRIENRVWAGAANHWAGFTQAGRAALNIADKVPAAVPAALTTAGRTLLGADTVPAYSGDLPAGGRARRELANPAADIVFFPSCLGTLFAGETRGCGGDCGCAGSTSAGSTSTGATSAGSVPPELADQVSEAFLAICARLGVEVRTPEQITGLCCGTPWSSKGMRTGHEAMNARVALELLEATDSGRLPVVVDASSCAEGIIKTVAAAGLEHTIRVVEAVSYVAERLPDVAPHVGSRLGKILVHPTCSSLAMGTVSDLERVAGAIAAEVVVPTDWGCCGFAGDRGMLHPELTASATADEASQVALEEDVDAYVSVNRTCEIGMSRATGQPYQHVLQVLAGRLT